MLYRLNKGLVIPALILSFSTSVMAKNGRGDLRSEAQSKALILIQKLEGQFRGLSANINILVHVQRQILKIEQLIASQKTVNKSLFKKESEIVGSLGSYATAYNAIESLLPPTDNKKWYYGAWNEKDPVMQTGRPVTDSTKLTSILQAGLTTLDEIKQCLSHQSSADLCAREFKIACGSFKYAKEGIGLPELTSSLNIKAHLTASFADYTRAEKALYPQYFHKGNFDNSYNELQYYVCLSLPAEKFPKDKTAFFKVHDFLSDPKFAEFYQFHNVFDEPRKVMKFCLGKISDQAWISKLSSIQNNYFSPDIDQLINNVKMRQKECADAVKHNCGTFNKVRGVPYISYVTKDCNRRDVTASDIDNDVQRFRAMGATEADLQFHLELKDQLRLCEKVDKMKPFYLADSVLFGTLDSEIESCKKTRGY